MPPFDDEQLAWKLLIEARPRLAGVKLTLTDVLVTTTVGREGLPGTAAASADGKDVDTRPDMPTAIASSHRPIDIGLSPRSACLDLTWDCGALCSLPTRRSCEYPALGNDSGSGLAQRCQARTQDSYVREPRRS